MNDKRVRPVTIDGSRGAGGGQVLRSSLALSMLTGRPVHLHDIRAGRRKPGLMRQHLTAVHAAAALCGADVRGAALGAREIGFAPGPVCHGEHRFAVGTAGSAALVFQTVLPALLTTPGRSVLVFEGGTHNPMSPPVDFLQRVFQPILTRMGARVELTLERHGFYPAGGGRFVAEVEGVEALTALELVACEPIVETSARVLLANLPHRIGRRELTLIRRELGWPTDHSAIEQVESSGPGNALLLEVRRSNVTELVTAFGARGVPSEEVAGGAVRELRRYLDSAAPVGEHLADQLLLPLAIAGGGRFATGALSSHTRTNIGVIEAFLPLKFCVEEPGEAGGVVTIGLAAGC